MSRDMMDGTHLYVVEFLDFGVKIGISDSPEIRISQHRRDADAYGRQVGRVWVSGKYPEAYDHEVALKRLGGPQQQREYLRLGFDHVCEVANRYYANRRPPEPESTLPEWMHGTWAAYLVDNCRCAECKRAGIEHLTSLSAGAGAV
jgi:hypothetical protein